MDLLDIFTFFSQKWLPNLVGTVGGLLGAYAFVDNYILRFNPKVFTGSQVFFQLDPEVKHCRQELEYILLSVQIGNHRKKYGMIYDFAVRFYVSGEINPSTVIYYASELAENIRLEDKKATPENIYPFKPIAILPNSDKSINLLLGEVVHRSKDSLDRGQHYSLELYYQTKPNGKWHFVNKVELYNSYTFGKKESDVQMAFTTLNYDTSREKIKKYTKSIPVSGVYKGASYKETDKSLKKIKYQYIQQPLFFLRHIGIYLGVKGFSRCDKLVDEKYRWPIIVDYFKNPKRFKLKMGYPELKPKGIEGLNLLYDILSEKAALLNLGIERGHDLVLKKISDTEFTISKYHLSMSIYLSNDKDMRVHGEGVHSRRRLIRYNLELKKGVFNQYYYHLENHGAKTIESFAVTLLDIIALQS